MRKALLKCLVYLNPSSKKHLVTIESLDGQEIGLVNQSHLNEESLEVFILEEREETALILLPQKINKKEYLWVNQENLIN